MSDWMRFVLEAAVGTLILNGLVALYFILRHIYLTREEEKCRKLRDFLAGRG